MDTVYQLRKGYVRIRPESFLADLENVFLVENQRLSVFSKPTRTTIYVRVMRLTGKFRLGYVSPGYGNQMFAEIESDDFWVALEKAREKSLSDAFGALLDVCYGVAMNRVGGDDAVIRSLESSWD